MTGIIPHGLFRGGSGGGRPNGGRRRGVSQGRIRESSGQISHSSPLAQAGQDYETTAFEAQIIIMNTQLYYTLNIEIAKDGGVRRSRKG